MTDKQIIIDGVDISGCEFYSYIESNKYPHRCTCYEDMYGASVVCDLSDCCKNCYYKQLKAKEQECERTKERLESFQKDYSKLYQVVENKGYIKELDQLKAENEELKELNTRLDNQREVYWKEYQKHKQAIEKIKEIAYELTNEEYTDFIEGKQKQILQICDEVNDVK